MTSSRVVSEWSNKLHTAIDAWREFLGSDRFHEATDVVDYYGWLAPASGLFVHAFSRAVAVYFTEPVVIKNGYLFPGWLGAFWINLLYTFFLLALVWFLYFGTVGAISGMLSSKLDFDTNVFKVGGYLSILFVPIFLVTLVLALTISGADTGVSDIGGNNVSQVAIETMAARVNIRNTTQMRLARLLQVTGWLVTGFVLRPMMAEFYGLSYLRSVLAVVPSTIAVVLFALLT